jgi:hypothetical protein
MAHHALAFLLPGIRPDPKFESRVFDIVIPICKAGSNCEAETKNLADAFQRENFPNLFMKGEKCAQCSKGGKLLRCSSCKIAR